MPVANHLYIRKKSIPKTDFRGKPQFIRPAFEKTFSSVIKKFCLKDMIETI